MGLKVRFAECKIALEFLCYCWTFKVEIGFKFAYLNLWSIHLKAIGQKL